MKVTINNFNFYYDDEFGLIDVYDTITSKILYSIKVDNPDTMYYERLETICYDWICTH